RFGLVILTTTAALTLLGHLARGSFRRRFCRRNFAPIAQRFTQACFIMNVRISAVIVGQLIIVIHLDGVKRTELGAETAIHTDVNINPELFWLWFWPAIGLGAALDPDT